MWTNSNMYATFNAQTISLGLSNYDGICIDYVFLSTNHDLGRIHAKGNIDETIRLFSIGNTNIYRTAKISSTGVTFSDMSEYTSYNGASTATDNRYIVPIFIYGIKYINL